MRSLLVIATVFVALAFAGPASAKSKRCPGLEMFGKTFPVRIDKGHTRCSTARIALRKFLPSNPHHRPSQHFTLAGREWYCFDSLGNALVKHHQVAHCNTPGPEFSIIVTLYEPGH